MKISKYKYYTYNNENKNNIIPIKKNYINKTINTNTKPDKDNWNNKKINLNFFENKNLIKELRAKYLPHKNIEIQTENNSELLLNKLDGKSLKELDDSHQIKNKILLNYNSKNSISSISKEDDIKGQINDNINLKGDKNEEIEKDSFNDKYKKNKDRRKKMEIKIKSPKQKKIVIENRFYTEIINSNILLDKNLILNQFNDGKNYSNINSKKEEEKERENKKINTRNFMNLEIIKNVINDSIMKENNHYISLSLKNMKLDSNKGSIGESSTNNELNKIKNKQIIENMFGVNNLHGIKNINLDSQCINEDENHEYLNKKIEKMQKEINNYEQLILPLISYINDINRILDQKEINPNDIPKIIKNKNPSKSSFYIKNLIRNLNESKNDIALQFLQKKQNKHRQKRNSNNMKKIKSNNFKTRRINRSAEDIKNLRFINSRISFDRNEQGNYFYENASDKYIFDYYKDRNINCSACLIGNNISQRGYSPGICCHLEDDNRKDEDRNI